MTGMLGRKTALLSMVIATSAVFLIVGSHPVTAQTVDGLDQERGLRIKTELVSPGYVLFSPIVSGRTYLIDNDGRVVNMWQSDYGTGHGTTLQDNGNLLRRGRVIEMGHLAGGQGGQIQEFTWEGELIWDYRLANDNYVLHHDATVLPNGNILAIAWEFKSAAEARAAGRRPDALGEAGLWSEAILELEKRGSNDAEIVWEWHVWDHSIQDFDSNADNYGVLSEHPELADINSDAPAVSAEDLAELRESGAVALIDDEGDARAAADNMHINGISYNAELDQIIVSIHDYHEFFVVDHSTTTAEAAGSTGGRYGMGGDILYRWGKASNYGRGGSRPQQLYGQHDAQWIPEGMPGAGNITVFNNNYPGAHGTHTVVFELEPPINDDGSYRLGEDGQYGPEAPVWIYQAPDGRSFHAPFLSSAQRLATGHTLINSGPQGRYFEVTPTGEIVWEYWMPYSGEASLPGHDFLVEDNDPTFYATFRATRIPPDHPALVGRDLSPLSPQPPLIPHDADVD